MDESNNRGGWINGDSLHLSSQRGTVIEHYGAWVFPGESQALETLDSQRPLYALNAVPDRLNYIP
jgi:hypothetical protein